MGNLLGIIGDLIPIITGLYCVLYFGGYKEPLSNDEEKLERFNAIKEKHGKKLTILGYVLMIFGVCNLVAHFIL